MGRNRNPLFALTKCRMCSKLVPKNTPPLPSIPRSFAVILEQMSGIEFSKTQGLQLIVCAKCKEFMRGMEQKTNKLSAEGKLKAQKLMARGVSAAIAIHTVLSEAKTQGATIPPVSTGEQRPKLSGAQNKKLKVLIEGGMEYSKARALIVAASEAKKSLEAGIPGQGGKVKGNLPIQRSTVVRNPAAIQVGLGQKRPNVQGGPGQKKPNLQVGPGQKKPNVQVGPAQKGGAQKGGQQRPNAPKGVGQQGPQQKGVAGQKRPLTAGQLNRQNNQANGGRTLNSDKRLGAYVNPRQNDRPAPYNVRPTMRSQNQMQNQQNGNFNQSQECPLEVGIVPINFPNDQLDDMKLEALKEAITNEIFKIPPGGPLIRFLGTSSQNGWLKLICADQISHNWLSMLVARWERAGVRMVEGNSLPQPVVLTVYLAGDFRSPDEILSILERQNNSLNTHQWRIVNRETDANGQTITVCVDEQSFQALQSRDFMVFLGLGIVEFKPRRFPSDGGTFNNNSSMQGGMGNNNNSNNNRSNYGSGNNNSNNSRGFSNGMGNNYQNNNSMGGGSFQRQGQFQSQRSW